MNPKTIRAEGYGRFDRFDVDIPTGTTAIIGPNGAGKSTLLNCIELCLFADGSRDLAPALGPFTERLEIELVFEHAGDVYRVIRSYRQTPGGAGKATVDFHLHFDGTDSEIAEWCPMNGEDAKATNAVIEQTIGLSRRTFGASAFLAQGNAAAFPDASPADRKAMLGEILDPSGMWPRLADRARTEARAAEQTITADVARISERETAVEQLPALQENLAALEQAKSDAADRLAKAEQLLEHAQTEAAANAAAAERLISASRSATTAREKHTLAGNELAAANTAAGKATLARVELGQVEEIAAAIPLLEQKVEERRAAVAARDAAEQQRTTAEQNAVRLNTDVGRVRREGEILNTAHAGLTARLDTLRHAEDGKETCDRCAQILGTEARQAAIVSITAELATVEGEIAAKVTALLEAEQAAKTALEEATAILVPEVTGDDHTPDLTAARAAGERRAALAVQIETLDEQAAQIADLEISLEEASSDLAAAEAQLAAASEGVKDDGDLQHAVTGARAGVAMIRTHLETVTADLVRTRQTVDRLRAVQAELVGLRSQISQTQGLLDTLRLAERAYGRDGIPALIAENVALPQIEAGANEILEQLPTSDGVTFRLELRTQAVNKTNTNIRETLDILVSDPDGERPIETYSGGERARLNIALRIALARLLARRRGAESRLLALDELEYLDELGQEKLVDVLRGLSADFDRVLVVSHAAGIRDSFDSTIVIEKSGGVSRVVPATVLEAVPS